MLERKIEKKETKNDKLAAVKERIFTHKPSAVNAQKLVIDQDINDLKAAEGNVRNKTRELEKLLQKSDQALELLKKNKSSQSARIKLTIPLEIKLFEEQQVTLIRAVRQKLEFDIVQYANDVMLQKMEYARYLELAFIYHTYEVCLEQEFRRHAAIKVLNNAKKNNDQAANTTIALLSSIPCKLAIETLNYYEDFFKNLAAIESIWPYAGKEIRGAEVKLIYAAVPCADMNNLALVIGDNKVSGYSKACADFEDTLTRYINANAFLKEYILRGDGLNANAHPYAYYRYKRLPQPNASINFREIVAIDAGHANAIQQIEQRVTAGQSKIR